MKKNKEINEEIPKALSGDAKEKKKTTKVKKVLLILVILAIIGVSSGGLLLYGPYSGFRDWLITTAIDYNDTSIFCNMVLWCETIEASLAKNKVEEVNEITNTNTIVIDNTVEETVYENEYERAVLEKDSNNDDYKIIEINGKGYSGYLAVIYDPSRIKTVYTKKLGTSGQYLKQMAKDNDALIAINGGGFEDPNFNSNGSDPLGITFSGGKLITSKTWNGSGGLIGFTEDNKLVLGKMTVKQAQEMKVRDGVTFGPFLIINGKKSTILGNGGWGTAPRTAIGQRKDGIVLFLVIDGRTVTKPGANMNDLIEIMENYGAYNAANLDGGTSSAMVVNGDIINDPIDSSGAHRTRFISTGFILTKK